MMWYCYSGESLLGTVIASNSTEALKLAYYKFPSFKSIEVPTIKVEPRRKKRKKK